MTPEKMTCEKCPFWIESTFAPEGAGFCSLFYDKSGYNFPFISPPAYTCGKTTEEIILMRLKKDKI